MLKIYKVEMPGRQKEHTSLSVLQKGSTLKVSGFLGLSEEGLIF